MNRQEIQLRTGTHLVESHGKVKERASGSAFTLIELIVVIAIIMLLIGLILPVLAHSKSAARSTVCASNLRQLAMANTAYSVEHDGYFVPGAANMAANLDRWHGQRRAMNEPFDPTRGPLWTYFAVAEVKQCPQFEQPSSGFEVGSGGYGYNNEYVGRDRRGDVFSELGSRLISFAHTAETVMFTDAAFVLPGKPTRIIEYSFAEPPLFHSGPADPSIHFRHMEATNVQWLDGHGTSERLQFTRQNVYGITLEQNRELQIGWFGPPDNQLFDWN